MSDATVPMCPVCASVGRSGWLLRQFDRVPYAVLALPLRLAVATIFWNSGMAKLADWNATLSLFTDEYRVPLLPPELAANIALAIEVTTPVLLVLGLLTRAAAPVLLGMTAFSSTRRPGQPTFNGPPCCWSCSAAAPETSRSMPSSSAFGLVRQQGYADALGPGQFNRTS